MADWPFLLAHLALCLSLVTTYLAPGGFGMAIAIWPLSQPVFHIPKEVIHQVDFFFKADSNYLADSLVSILIP